MTAADSRHCSLDNAIAGLSPASDFWALVSDFWSLTSASFAYIQLATSKFGRKSVSAQQPSGSDRVRSGYHTLEALVFVPSKRLNHCSQHQRQRPHFPGMEVPPPSNSSLSRICDLSKSVPARLPGSQVVGLRRMCHCAHCAQALAELI